MSGDSGAAALEVGASGASGASGRALDTSVPGPRLAARLAEVDVDSLDDHALIEHLAATERLIAWATSLQLHAAAGFARRPSRIERVTDDPAAVRAHGAPLGEWAREFADDEVAARCVVAEEVAPLDREAARTIEAAFIASLSRSLRPACAHSSVVL